MIYVTVLRRLVAGDASLEASVRAKGGGDRGAPRREGRILRVVVGVGRLGPNGGRQKILAELDVLRTRRPILLQKASRREIRSQSIGRASPW